MPTRMSRLPSAAFFLRVRLVEALTLPVISPTVMAWECRSISTLIRLSPSSDRARPPSSLVTVAKCCSASTSVGAMMEPWKPQAVAANKAASATTVLPLPTSPWRSRFMGGAALRMSPITSATHRSWALVSGKGREPKKESSIPGAGATSYSVGLFLPGLAAGQQDQLHHEELVECQPLSGLLERGMSDG